MKLVSGILIFFFAAVIEVTLLDSIQVVSVKPSLFLVALILISLFWGRSPGMWFGFASGMFLDLFSPEHMGLNMLILTSAGFLIGSLSTTLYREKYVSQVLTLLFVSLVEPLLYFAFSSEGPYSFILFFVRYGVPGAIYTTVVGAAIFFGLHLARVRWKVS